MSKYPLWFICLCFAVGFVIGFSTTGFVFMLLKWIESFIFNNKGGVHLCETLINMIFKWDSHLAGE